MTGSEGPVPAADLAKGAAGPAATGEGDRPAQAGCLVAVVRVPVRVFAFAVILPLRFLWELLVLVARPVGAALGWTGRAAGRGLYRLLVQPFVALHRHLLAPLGRGLARAGRLAAHLLLRLCTGLWRTALLPALTFLGRFLLRPLGRFAEWLLLGLVRLVAGAFELLLRLFDLVVLLPAGWLVRAVLVPVGKALGRFGLALGRLLGSSFELLVVRTARWLWRYVLRPSGAALRRLGAGLVRLAVDAVGLAARLLVATARLLVRLFVLLLVRPVAWLGRSVLAPAGRWLIAADVALGRALVLLARLLLTAFARLVEYLVLIPLAALGRYVLRPAADMLIWLVEHLLLVPLGWLWRVLLFPLLRELGRAVLRAWRLGGRIWRFAVVRPCRWARREVWWPVKEELRRARRTVGETIREVRRSVRETIREVRRSLTG
ncbi:hypothetical protein GCM10010495_18450 [Kitasatospora herbaricolor]|uniref:hypothetical protein n=1 Tax=Kitasatospora herbaricolor TaxID=68217 RepID=UPI00174C08E0|nr:hypothetical protein [Kitasatospora herbaricolor]MDQ0308292.1 hypothetical protein [Kitasatospora herbaricolor]GGV06536.1 hypothetical protein GCM10010495_18450 [Kitasatospora herbaricolor]